MFSLTEIICPRIPKMVHSIVDSDDIIYGTTVTQSCHIGHEFNDGSTMRSVTCSEAGMWSSHVIDCEGTCI